MLTVLSEIERTINNRPLTYVYEDLTEEPLTPNHLIFGKRIHRNVKSNENIDKVEDISENLKNLLEHFWKRWQFEYLLELREFHKVRSHVKDNELIKLNDIVLISEENIKRNKWRIGRINKLLRGNDGKVRGAEVVVVNKTGNGLLRRPISKLFPFESKDSHKEIDDDTNEHSDEEIDDDKNELVFVHNKDVVDDPIVGRGVSDL